MLLKIPQAWFGILMKGCSALISTLHLMHIIYFLSGLLCTKMKLGKPTVKTVKNNVQGIIDRFLASDTAFSFVSSVKRTLAYKE